jgi:hypothetical protein
LTGKGFVLTGELFSDMLGVEYRNVLALCLKFKWRNKTMEKKKRVSPFFARFLETTRSELANARGGSEATPETTVTADVPHTDKYPSDTDEHLPYEPTHNDDPDD